MYQKPLQWLIDLLRSLFSSEAPIPHPTEIAPLTPQGYEALLVQVAEGVGQGWDQAQLWERLGIRRHDPWFVSWLQRYGRSLLRQRPEQIDRDFAQRLIRLGVLGCGELGTAAQSLGRRLWDLSHTQGEVQSTEQPALPATTVTSDSAQELFDYGMAFYHKQEWEGALSLWQEALQLEPDFWGASNACGVVLYLQDRASEALPYFDAVIAQQPQSAIAYFNRGLTALKLAKLSSAQTDLTTALTLDAAFYHAYVVRGTVYHQLGLCEAALQDFNAAIALQADWHWAYNGRGLVYSAQQQYDAALQDFNAVLSREPNCVEAYHNRGIVLCQLHQWLPALENFSQAIVMEPNFAAAYHSRGNLHLELGQPERAWADYREAIQLQPNYCHAYNGRGVALTALGRYSDAIADFDWIVQQQTTHWQAWANRGWAMYHASAPLGPAAALENWQAGLEVLQEAADEPLPLAVQTLYDYLGQAWQQQAENPQAPLNALELAVHYYHKALDACQDEKGLERIYLETLQRLILVYLRLGNVANGKNYLNIALLILKQMVLNGPTVAQKQQLLEQFQGLSQLQVDQLAQSLNPYHQAQAIEMAEDRNYLYLRSLLDPHWDGQLRPSGVTYGQMQKLLNPQTAIVYWHLSPASLTTFILVDHQPPIIMSTDFGRRQALQAFWEEWQQLYQQHLETENAPSFQDQWRSRLPDLLTQLAQLLALDTLCAQLPESVERLIFVPHQWLVALPLAAVFHHDGTKRRPTARRFAIAQLPALHAGMVLNFSPQMPTAFTTDTPLLGTASAQTHTALELVAIGQHFAHHYPPYATLTPTQLLGQLQRPFNIFHCATEVTLDLDRPLQSGILCEQEFRLTSEALRQPTYNTPPLVCFSSSELRWQQHHHEERDWGLGLPLVLLDKGSSYILISLWRVSELSTVLLMWYFYGQIALAIPPAQALSLAQQWLAQLTYGEVLAVYEQWQQEFAEIPAAGQHHLQVAIAVTQDKIAAQGRDRCPYEHPYYWAGFTMVGKVD